MPIVIDKQYKDIYNYLAENLPKVTYDTWFANTHIIELNDKIIELAVANAFLKKWISNKYRDIIIEAVKKVSGHSVDVKITISAKLFNAMRKQQQEAAISSTKEIANNVPKELVRKNSRFLGLELNKKLLLNNFITGSSNRLAYASADRITDNPGEYSPLYIFGPPGTGKTHLLQGICAETLKKSHAGTIAYLSAEKFLNDFTANFVGNKKVDQIKHYKECSLLVIDDLQVLAQGNKLATQEQLLSTIDHIYARGGQIVFSADKSPADLGGLIPKLRDRLEGGLIVKIDYPDVQTRKKLIVKLLAVRKIVLTEELLDLLTDRMSGNVREIEGVVLRLAALINLEGLKPDAHCIKMALEVSGAMLVSKKLYPDDIIKAVAREYNVVLEDVLGRGRARKLCQARQVAMVLLRSMTNISLAEVGRIFSGRTHATVLSAIRKTPSELFNDPLFSRPIERILFNLGCTKKPSEVIVGQTKLF